MAVDDAKLMAQKKNLMCKRPFRCAFNPRTSRNSTVHSIRLTRIQRSGLNLPFLAKTLVGQRPWRGGIFPTNRHFMQKIIFLNNIIG